MIAGTILIEDQAIQFAAQFDGKVIYTVSDNLTGEAETKKVDGAKFMVALGIALNFAGEIPCDVVHAFLDAESIQPENKILRFIP